MHSLDMEARDGTCRVRLGAEVTIYQAGELRAALAGVVADHEDLEIDLGAVTEIDTAGVQLLLHLKREAAACGHACRYVQHSEAVIEVFDALNMAGLFGDPMVLAGS
jgi:anti-anti-sigma factor